MGENPSIALGDMDAAQKVVAMVPSLGAEHRVEWVAGCMDVPMEAFQEVGLSVPMVELKQTRSPYTTQNLINS